MAEPDDDEYEIFEHEGGFLVIKGGLEGVFFNTREEAENFVDPQKAAGNA